MEQPFVFNYMTLLEHLPCVATICVPCMVDDPSVTSALSSNVCDPQDLVCGRAFIRPEVDRSLIDLEWCSALTQPLLLIPRVDLAQMYSF
jgi:hypothetical protein